MISKYSVQSIPVIGVPTRSGPPVIAPRYAFPSMFFALWLAPMATLAQTTPVYYDYVENGKMGGGRLLLDATNAEDRKFLGLDHARAAQAPVWPVTTIRNSGPIDNRVNIVLLGDGYTAAEMGLYAAHCDAIIDNFFSQEPFNAYRNYFNVHRVDVVSNESGVDEPDLGVFRDTALDMTYGCAGIDRLLCVDVGKAYDAAASAPAFDQILVLANSDHYGGAGYPSANLGTLAGDNFFAVEIALHEFGHSFADLADEYDYADGVVYSGSEPIDPNASVFTAAQQTAGLLKWFRWMDLPHVDAFEGAVYSQFGIYRPTTNSKMRSLDRPFEEINVEQFVVHTYRVVQPLDSHTPLSPSAYPPTNTFFVDPLQPVDHALSIQWFVDDVPIAGATLETFTPSEVPVGGCGHDIRVEVVDDTPRVRDELLRQTYMRTVLAWFVESPGPCPAPRVVWNSNDLSAERATRSLQFDVAPMTYTPDASAIRVRMIDLQNPQPPNPPCCPPPDFSDFEWGTCTAAEEFGNCERWLGPPTTVLETQSGSSTSSFLGSRLQCSPYYTDWTLVGPVAVFGAEIVPSSTYEITTFASECENAETSCSNISGPVEVRTRRSGDVTANFNPPGTGAQPDALDVVALVNKFRNTMGAPSKRSTQIQPHLPELNADVNALDIVAVVDAFRGLAYAFGGPCPCPASVFCDSIACTASSQCGGGTCIRTCEAGTNNDQPCLTPAHCPGGGTCGSGFCRDRCGRCR